MGIPRATHGPETTPGQSPDSGLEKLTGVQHMQKASARPSAHIHKEPTCTGSPLRVKFQEKRPLMWVDILVRSNHLGHSASLSLLWWARAGAGGRLPGLPTLPPLQGGTWSLASLCDAPASPCQGCKSIWAQVQPLPASRANEQKLSRGTWGRAATMPLCFPRTCRAPK